MKELHNRYYAALEITQAAAQTALNHFSHREALNIESKGTQDWVSNADREVELQIRKAITASYPNDAIIGEEHDNKSGNSEFSWVIDPIDGTSSFVSGIPGWCVVLAGVKDGRTVFGVIVDPVAKEVFSACDGLEPILNNASTTLQISSATSLKDGSLAVGHSTRFDHNLTMDFLSVFLEKGGIFYRNGSGALMLAYVASGRLIGYVEPHMYAWDCLAGLYLIERAGGVVQPFDHTKMLESGGRVVASAPALYDEIVAITDDKWMSC